jgi:hypothetical protein
MEYRNRANSLKAGAATMRYDRAGLGKSEPAPLPYTIDTEADALASSLNTLRARFPQSSVEGSTGACVNHGPS